MTPIGWIITAYCAVPFTVTLLGLRYDRARNPQSDRLRREVESIPVHTPGDGL